MGESRRTAKAGWQHLCLEIVNKNPFNWNTGTAAGATVVAVTWDESKHHVFNCIIYTPEKAVMPENRHLSHLQTQIAQPWLLSPGATADRAHSWAVGRGSVMERWNRRMVVLLGKESQQQAGLWERRGVIFVGIWTETVLLPNQRAPLVCFLFFFPK